MTYDLWDTETSNYFGRFRNEAEVLKLVQTLVSRCGEAYADELGLGRVDDAGTILPPLTGQQLIARMREVLEPDPATDEHRGVVIGSAMVAFRQRVFSIEPWAAAAGRAARRVVSDVNQRRSQRA
jgi:hypothetical protein